jgi:hypothetical protein
MSVITYRSGSADARLAAKHAAAAERREGRVSPSSLAFSPARRPRYERVRAAA